MKNPSSPVMVVPNPRERDLAGRPNNVVLTNASDNLGLLTAKPATVPGLSPPNRDLGQ
jgi:hypothetical protein